MKYLFILISPVLCQYAMVNQMRPDVTFGEHNDRFDLTNYIRQQKKVFNENAIDRESGEYRRRGEDRGSWMDVFTTKRDRQKMRKTLMKKIEDQANEIANALITKIRSLRRYDGAFAHHDDMLSDGTNVEDYQKNLKKMDHRQNLKENSKTRRLQRIVHRLHGQETRRIVTEPENEILMHYGFPVNVKIEGFLQRPVNKTI